MNTPKDGGQAFPTPLFQEVQPGMTQRAYIATAALQGLVASNFYDRYNVSRGDPKYPEPVPLVAANLAVEYADALLARLDQSPLNVVCTPAGKPI